MAVDENRTTCVCLFWSHDRIAMALISKYTVSKKEKLQILFSRICPMCKNFPSWRCELIGAVNDPQTCARCTEYRNKVSDSNGLLNLNDVWHQEFWQRSCLRKWLRLVREHQYWDEPLVYSARMPSLDTDCWCVLRAVQTDTHRMNQMSRGQLEREGSTAFSSQDKKHE